MAYLLDSNVFIEAKNTYYDFEVCPAFWSWIDSANDAGTVFSIIKVFDEMKDYKDPLAEWVKARKKKLFVDLDESTNPSLRAIAQWASTNSSFRDDAKHEFLTKAADYYLVAFAHAHGHTVVSREVDRNTRRKIQIPVVCNAFGVSWVTPFDMLRSENVRFVLSA